MVVDLVLLTLVWLWLLRTRRLTMAPPAFPAGLNSYQRMLIHRLADRFGIKREVESVPTGQPIGQPAWPSSSSGGLSSGVVVLVKTENAAV